mmetsp:Transcript_3081/g.8724  ORF Transcript_3081/g.8724 Transcript_3081/m.8724 type:complete len:97 (-) Transcript_3081:541-831(-)
MVGKIILLGQLLAVGKANPPHAVREEPVMMLGSWYLVMAAVPGRDRAFDMNLDAAAEGLKAYVDDEDHDSDGDTPDASRCRGGIVHTTPTTTDDDR